MKFEKIWDDWLGLWRDVVYSLRFIRAFITLIPAIWNALYLWNREPTYEFIASWYPLKWERAVSIFPDFEVLRNEESKR